MEKFTRQELIYIARSLRLEAAANEKEAEDPKYGTADHNWTSAAKALRELADKADRLAKLAR